jgi:hypothetical protein
MDRNQFWKLINSKSSRPGAEMKFNGRVFRDQLSIRDNWKNYFEQLYNPEENVMFDQQFKSDIEQQVSEAMASNVHL